MWDKHFTPNNGEADQPTRVALQICSFALRDVGIVMLLILPLPQQLLRYRERYFDMVPQLRPTTQCSSWNTPSHAR